MRRGESTASRIDGARPTSARPPPRAPHAGRPRRGPALLGFALAAFALACGDEAETEARAFLARVELVDIGTPPTERERFVEALDGLELSTDEVKTVRDVCLRGHRSLLEAENAQLEAAEALGRATEGDREARIAPEEAARIEATIARSSEAIEEARGLLERCQDGTSDLRSRYGARR